MNCWFWKFGMTPGAPGGTTKKMGLLAGPGVTSGIPTGFGMAMGILTVGMLVAVTTELRDTLLQTGTLTIETSVTVETPVVTILLVDSVEA